MRKSEITRHYIIEKTAPVFNKKGYAGTSIRDLTYVTGLTKGSIYGNFRNKDEVALEAFNFNLKKIIRMFSAEIDKEQGAINKLLCYIRIYLRNYISIHENGGCPILNTAIEADDTHEELSNAVKKAIRYWRLGIEKIIKTGIKKKEIKPGIDATYYSGLFFSIIDGSFMVARIMNDKNLFEKNMDHIKQIILHELSI